eukprot:1285065-Lingulodinium_polyedra.AAC.1
MEILATGQINAPKSGNSYTNHARRVKHLVAPAGLTLSHDGQKHICFRTTQNAVLSSRGLHSWPSAQT